MIAVQMSATFSICRAYRYTLTRQWSDGPTCVFIGLNPSTADETKDDPTIRRCVKFAQSWGHGKLVMLNAYAYRATDPVVMLKQADPFGADNYPTLEDQCKDAEIVVAAWGNNIDALHERRVLRAINREVYCLKKTNKGHPWHPLYVKGDTKPFLFWQPEPAEAE
jgi:hypothetical protein